MGILPNPKERKQEKRIVKRKRNRTMKIIKKISLKKYFLLTLNAFI
jgi:hypothetical protein